MKFSVKNLLATTLLAALIINGCITYFQLSSLQIEHSKLNSRLNIYRRMTVNYQQRKRVFERAAALTQQRKRDYQPYKKSTHPISTDKRSVEQSESSQ